ncbi:endonuclease/exonuclease/phosphatase family protein [Christiangramia aquimixticola]|uniref:endonuclease/exonuclease/phosphatase family protein n=1 Tax=Christiangramia aquimixticola TaxID=1697558 RepID=UPI003AA88DAB
MSLRKIFYYFIILISSLVIIASLLSLFYNLPYWYSKLLDFPRLQYLILGIICLILFPLLTKKWKWPAISFFVGIIASIFIQSVKIFPYWFGEKSVPDAVQFVSEENTVSILLANVLITNKNSEKLLNVVQQENPDMIIAMEVNQWWLDALKPLANDYPYVLEQPNDVAYGMALYSRFPFKNAEVKYIKHENVPSFHGTVELESGKEFVLHAVHPVAPMPSDKYPDNVGEAEIELVRVGEMVSNEKLPSIVAGDFNDVSWSNTSRLFGENGKLNNVRLGRGLYNTFDANSMIMRWPLDHYYVTDEFSLVELKRLGEIGSDHFPIVAKFHLAD